MMKTVLFISLICLAYICPIKSRTISSRVKVSDRSLDIFNKDTQKHPLNGTNSHKLINDPQKEDQSLQNGSNQNEKTHKVYHSRNLAASDIGVGQTVGIIVGGICVCGGCVSLGVCCCKKHCNGQDHQTDENKERLSTNHQNIAQSENDSPLDHRIYNLPDIRDNISNHNKQNINRIQVNSINRDKRDQYKEDTSSHNKQNIYPIGENKVSQDKRDYSKIGVFAQKREKKAAIFVGETASGKSSLLNKLFGAKQDIGAGDCTENIQKISWSGPVEIYDSPGIVNNTMLGDNTEWEVFLRFDMVFVVYEYSLVRIDRFVKYLIENKKDGIYFVRNKCDNFNDEKLIMGLDGQLAKDKSKLKEWGYSEPIIYCTSNKPNNSFDNEKLKRLLK